MSHQLMNCAGNICCFAPATATEEEKAFNQEAHAARVQLLMNIGATEEQAHKMSKAMVDQGMVFLTQELADAIRHVAFPEHP